MPTWAAGARWLRRAWQRGFGCRCEGLKA